MSKDELGRKLKARSFGGSSFLLYSCHGLGWDWIALPLPICLTHRSIIVSSASPLSSRSRTYQLPYLVPKQFRFVYLVHSRTSTTEFETIIHPKSGLARAV